MQTLQTMMTWTAAGLLTAVVACGGGETPSGPDAAPGPPRPQGVLAAFEETGDKVFTARTIDLSCRGTPSADQPTAVAITANARIIDFQYPEDVVPEPTVTLFADTNINSPFATATGDVDGNVTLEIPVGQTRIGWKMVAEDYLDTLYLNQYYDPNTTPIVPEVKAVSQATSAALPGLVGITRTPGRGIVAGRVYDCNTYEIANFVATVSAQSGVYQPVDGARTFYFKPETGLPVRTTLEADASPNGLFAVLELPAAATAYVQTWGYVTQADLDADVLTQLTEMAVPVIGDTVVTGSFELIRN